jgi:hypothetical protein
MLLFSGDRLKVYKITQHILFAPPCPEPNVEQAYEHPDNCDQFFLCTNGTLTLKTCENGLLYDGKGNVYIRLSLLIFSHYFPFFVYLSGNWNDPTYESFEIVVSFPFF